MHRTVAQIPQCTSPISDNAPFCICLRISVTKWCIVGSLCAVGCSLIIGTGYWVQFFSLILNSSVGLSAYIQSAGDSVPETLGSNPACSRGWNVDGTFCMFMTVCIWFSLAEKRWVIMMPTLLSPAPVTTELASWQLFVLKWLTMSSPEPCQALYQISEFQLHFHIWVPALEGLKVYRVCTVILHKWTKIWRLSTGTGYGVGQWETMLHCNVVSHKLTPYPEWCLININWTSDNALIWWRLTSNFRSYHCNDVIMGAMGSQITSLAIVYSTGVYWDADQSKHQSFASLALVWRIHRRPVNAENVSIWWRHHASGPSVLMIMMMCIFTI